MLFSEETMYWIGLFNTFGWFLLIPIMERIWAIYQQPFWRWGLITDTLYTYQNIVLQYLFIASSPIILEAIMVSAVALHFFPADGSGFLQYSLNQQSILLNLLVMVVIGEITFYSMHYFCHKIPFLWEFHRVHHSSVILDSFSTSRFHVLDRVLFTFPPLLILAYLGSRPDALVIYFFFRNFMDRYIHSNINGPRWVHKIGLSSPHFHRWHHACDEAAWDKNFSGDFIVLDLLFGTAYDPDPKEKSAPKTFGEIGYSNNIIWQQFLPFFHLFTRIKAEKNMIKLFALSKSGQVINQS